MTQMADHFGFKTTDDLIASVGYGKITPLQIVSKFVQKPDSKTVEDSLLNKLIGRVRKKKPHAGVIVKGVDEVLLRVFVLSGMVWLLLSWGRVTRNEAAVIAVIVAAVVESALHLPGILSTGFPGAVSATAYLLTAVMIPGLAFGALYWTRGLRAAVLTHAASALVLTLILL